MLIVQAVKCRESAAAERVAVTNGNAVDVKATLLGLSVVAGLFHWPLEMEI